MNKETLELAAYVAGGVAVGYGTARLVDWMSEDDKPAKKSKSKRKSKSKSKSKSKKAA